MFASEGFNKAGNTDHRHADPDLRNRWPFTAAYFLTERLAEADEAHQIDEDRLWHELVHGAAFRDAFEASIQITR